MEESGERKRLWFTTSSQRADAQRFGTPRLRKHRSRVSGRRDLPHVAGGTAEGSASQSACAGCLPRAGRSDHSAMSSPGSTCVVTRCHDRTQTAEWRQLRSWRDLCQAGEWSARGALWCRLRPHGVTDRCQPNRLDDRPRNGGNSGLLSPKRCLKSLLTANLITPNDVVSYSLITGVSDFS